MFSGLEGVALCRRHPVGPFLLWPGRNAVGVLVNGVGFPFARARVALKECWSWLGLPARCDGWWVLLGKCQSWLHLGRAKPHWAAEVPELRRLTFLVQVSRTGHAPYGTWSLCSSRKTFGHIRSLLLVGSHCVSVFCHFHYVTFRALHYM